MGLSSKKIWLAPLLILVVILTFQNCGPGFKTLSSTSQSTQITLGTPAPTPAPAPPVNNSPQITAPAAAIGLGMNAPFKIVIPITDADTAAAQVTYVVRAAPQRGTLTLDAGDVAANRGVTYTPNANYLGTDSFVLNVIDPQGNMGPDQRFNILVEAKGIGQMVGTFTKAACTPNTSPVTGTYTSNLTAYELRQIIYSQNCATPILEHIMTGNHTIGLENVATLGGVLGFEYNVTNSRVTVRPVSAAAAQAMNAQVYCGINNWVVNVVRDITAAGCNGVWAGPNLFMYRRVEFPVGQPARLIYSSSTSGGAGTTPQTRTQGLELNTVFIRP